VTGEPVVTIVGNLGGDVELRFTPSGAAVANFTVASTPRTFNKQTNAWDDGETLWMRCSVWREAAENVAESLTKGARVVVTGRLKSRSYEKDGQNRTSIEMDVDEVGPSLRYASAKVTKAERSGGQQGGGFGQPAQQAEFGGQVAAGQQAQQTAQQPAPWGQQPAQAPAWGQQQGWGQPQPQGAPQQAVQQQQQQAAQQGQQPQQQDQWTTPPPTTDLPPY